MRPWLFLALVLGSLTLGVPARADVVPSCPPGQVPDCHPGERSHGCGGCVPDPNAPTSGCALVPGAAASGGSLVLLVAATLRLRRRRR